MKQQKETVQARRISRKITDIIWNSGCTVSKPMINKVARFLIDEAINEIDFVIENDLSGSIQLREILRERRLFLLKTREDIKYT